MKKRTVLLLLLLTVCVAPLRSQLVINELMQSNVDCIMDDLNDFPDSWVELYNAGDTALPLSGYRIGKTAAAASAWPLPATQIAAHGYVLVCCDKAGKGLHTDFRLESGKGGSVFLFLDNQPIDWVTALPKQPAPNTAYGRRTDGDDEWGYLLTPTPGAANEGTLAKGTLGVPRISPAGRVQTISAPFNLSMSIPEGSPKGTHIRYTTDGSEPTDRSARYAAPLRIGGTTIIRARLFCDGWLSPPSICQSFIFFPQNRPLTLPVVSIVTDGRYLYDPYIGIEVDGRYQEDKPNYKFNWRRPVNIELFETSGVAGSINQLCEMRVFGGSSRERTPRSLVVYANKRFGTKRFDYEFFPDQRPGITDYKSIALRNAGNDFHDLYMRDAIIQRTMARYTDLDWQAWRPAIIYVNGQYIGMLNLRDRSNEDNVYTYHDGLEDIDLISNFGILEEGTMDHFIAFRTFYNESGHTMEEYEQWMDCHEFINLMAMNIYHTNWDFPGNNSILWRPRAEGGRWRFIAKDLDSGLGLYNLTPEFDYIEWLYNTDYSSSYYWGNRPAQTLLFRQLMEDETFRRTFIDHFAVYMGDFLNERGTREVWDAMFGVVKTELPFHRSLNSRSWSQYEEEMARARLWLSRRTAIAYRQTAAHYGLGTPMPLTVNVAATDSLNTQVVPAECLAITINGIPVRRGCFDGMYFAGSELTVEATDADGQAVAGWHVEMTDTTGTVTTATVLSPTYTFTMPVCDSLALHAISDNNTGIASVAVADRPATGIYSLQGVRQSRLRKGLNIVEGKKIVRR